MLCLSLVASGLAAKVLEAPVHIERPTQVMKRDVFGSIVANEVFYYAAEVDIGSPPQPVRVVLDTGSSDLWVMKSTNPYCQNATHSCSYKTFNTDESLTYNNTGEPFAIRYGDMSYAQGDWATDHLHFAGAELDNVKFAVASQTNSTQIVLGIGLTTLESTVEKVTPDGVEQGTYNNIPQLFKTQGYIDHVMYSLWLNGHDSTYGSVLFGGIDKSKFEGNLTRVPMVNLSKKLPNPYSFHVMINGVKLENGNGEHELATLQYPALLDSGTSFAYLPPTLVQAMATSIGFRFSPLLNYYIGPCSVPKDQTFLVNFSGKDIRIPLSSLVMQYSADDPSVCAFTVLPSHSEYSTILGDVFLRNIYAVFDLENYEIGLAQALSNVTESDVVSFNGTIPGHKAPLYNTKVPNDQITVSDVKAAIFERSNAGLKRGPYWLLAAFVAALVL